MSQAGIALESGSQTDLSTLEDDNGDTVTQQIQPILGAEYGTSGSKIDFTDIIGTDFFISNQTFSTPYVVDSSSTFGTRGTYSTIQSAVTAAVSDQGGGLSTSKVVLIRPGTYTENISIPEGIFLVGTMPSTAGGNDQGQTTHPMINGVVTFTNSGSRFSGIYGMAINDYITSATSSLVCINNCYFGQDASRKVEITGTGGSYYFTNCTFNGFNDAQPDLNLGSSNYSYFKNCDFGSYGTSGNDISQAVILFGSSSYGYFYDCINIKRINSGNSTLVFCNGCSFYQNTNNTLNYFISGTGAGGSLVNCVFGNSNGSNPAFPTSGYAIQDDSGPWLIESCTADGGILYEPATVVNCGQAIQGSIIPVVTTGVNYNVQEDDHYIAATTDSITITLPDPSTVTNGKTYVIKKEFSDVFNAGITIDTASGNIDGQSSISLLLDYASVTVVARVTDYYII